MKNEKEFLLDELREHTSDCDYARAQHYYEEKRYKSKADIFNTIQAIVFLSTIAMYVLIVSGVYENMVLKMAGLVLSVASTLLELMSYMLKYNERANQHWKAAQMYSELYRKCQFFCSDYAKCSTEVWREKLRDISEELSRLALMSPTLSDESYQKGCMHLSEKRYPVHKAILNQKMSELDEVIDAIKRVFGDKKIEIYLFGSYIHSMYYNDIDMAVIVHDTEISIAIKEEINKIESNYLLKGIKLDVSVITEDDIIANRCTQYIKNICGGICYYKSLDIKKSLQDYEIALSNYPEMIQYFADKAYEHYGKNEKDYIQNAFYAYYHGLTAILSFYNVNWYGEKSLVNECDLLVSQKENFKEFSVDKEDFVKLVQHARLYLDEKEKVFLNNEMIQKTEYEVMHNYFMQDKEVLFIIAQNISMSIK